MQCITLESPQLMAPALLHITFISQFNKTTSWSHKTLIFVPMAPLRVVKQSISNKERILVNKWSLLIFFLFYFSSTGQTRPRTASHTGSIYFNNVGLLNFTINQYHGVYMGQSTKHRECLYYYFIYHTDWRRDWSTENNNTTWPDSTPNYPTVPQ